MKFWWGAGSDSGRKMVVNVERRQVKGFGASLSGRKRKRVENMIFPSLFLTSLQSLIFQWLWAFFLWLVLRIDFGLFLEERVVNYILHFGLFTCLFTAFSHHYILCLFSFFTTIYSCGKPVNNYLWKT